jgi:mycothiol system anti-sigma-R factor
MTMQCQDARDLLHAYADDELDAVTSRALEAHLGACPACARAFESDRAVKAALRNPALLYAAPAALRERVASTLPRPDTGDAKRHVRSRPPWRAWALAASLVLAAALAWRFAGRAGESELVAQAALASHMRSLQSDEHLLDVRSTDQHTVKPWFAGKVDFAPPVRDLAEQGFPLVGGRLDFLRDRPAAALVYRRNKHVINLFVAPGDGGRGETERQGYHLVHWTGGGMTFWAVSDVNAAELRHFTELFRADAPPSTRP